MSNIPAGQWPRQAAGPALVNAQTSGAAGTSGATTGVPQTAAVSLAGNLSDVQVGMRILGNIVGHTGSDQPILRTDQGLFVITGRGPMPQNTRLMFQVLAVGETVKAMILSRNGQVLHPPSAMVLQPATLPPATATAPHQPLGIGATFPAVITAQPVSGSALAAAPGTAFSARVIAIDAPEAANQVRPQPGGGGAMLTQGSVVGRDPAGALLVRSTVGMVALTGAGEAGVGTRLELELLPLRAASTGAQTVGPVSPMSGWPAVEELMSFLQAHDPALARAFAQKAIPRANAHTLRAVMFLVSALRGGDVGAWLGAETVRLLHQHGRAPLLDRLRDDFVRLAGGMDEPEAGDWRILTFPFFDDGRWRMANLYSRRGGDAEDDGEDETRFVLSFALSRLGDLQLDGLVKTGRFDLILRSAEDLGGDMRRDIGEIFTQALEIGGYQGTLRFQAGTPFPIDPDGDLRDASGPGAPVLA